MKKRFLLIICLMIISISLIGCQSKESETNDYLSISFSKFIRDREEYDIPYNDSEFETIICEYDLENKQVKEVFSYPQNTFYSLGVYDKKANTVYYTKEKDNDSYQRVESGDQIYAYNLETKEDKMLTEDLYAVNKIVPVDEYLFFLAAFKDNYNLVLGKVDLKNGEVSKWAEEDQMVTRNLAVDKKNKRIYAAIYNIDEEYENMEADLGPANTTLVSFDFDLKDKKEILKLEGKNIKALEVKDNNLLYSIDTFVRPGEYTNNITEIINLKSGETIYKADQEIPSMTYLSSDLKGFYYSTFNSNEIIYYDLENDSYESLLIEAKKPGNLVNFQLFD